ncbi:MAG: DsrE family protein [Planctomycetes bacterium]|nr:DsrE family protein [Planctomycetota bacterium]
MKTVLVLNQDQMGHGDRELGQRVLCTFLQKAIAIEGLEAVLFYNAGVRLVASDSPVISELRELENRGVDLTPCGTCVQAYEVEVQVGQISDMETIVREIGAAQKVVTL